MKIVSVGVAYVPSGGRLPPSYVGAKSEGSARVVRKRVALTGMLDGVLVSVALCPGRGKGATYEI